MSGLSGGSGGAAAVGEPLLEVGRGNRVADQKALHVIAAMFGDEGQLLCGFDPLSGDLHVQAFAQLRDGAHDRHAAGIVGQLPHEGPVDLDPADRKAVEVAERGIARAEIVERDADAKLAQPVQRPQRRLVIAEQGGFGDFQFQPAGGQPAEPV